MLKMLKRLARWYFRQVGESTLLMTPSGMIPYDIVKRMQKG